MLGRNNHDHADAAVEGAVHLALRHATFFLQPLEQLGHGPALGIDLGDCIFRQHARYVLADAATGDVCHALDRQGLHEFEQRFHVDTGRCHHDIGQRFAIVEFCRVVGLGQVQDLAYKRIAVGMGTV